MKLFFSRPVPQMGGRCRSTNNFPERREQTLCSFFYFLFLFSSSPICEARERTSPFPPSSIFPAARGKGRITRPPRPLLCVEYGLPFFGPGRFFWICPRALVARFFSLQVGPRIFPFPVFFLPRSQFFFFFFSSDEARIFECPPPPA